MIAIRLWAIELNKADSVFNYTWETEPEDHEDCIAPDLYRSGEVSPECLAVSSYLLEHTLGIL